MKRKYSSPTLLKLALHTQHFIANSQQYNAKDSEKGVDATEAASRTHSGDWE